MSFAFKRKESVAEGVCRIARKGVAKAQKACAKPGAESLHAARKQIKRLRALLRLLRPQIGKRSFAQAKDALWDAAQHLAPARDAHVLVQSLDHTAAGRDRRNPQGDRFAKLRKVLDARRREEEKRFAEHDRAAEVHQKLAKALSRIEKLKLADGGWDAIGPGLKKSYKAAQRAHETAAAEQTPQNLHAWRKRMKDLLYHLELLHRIWPEQLCAMVEDFDRVTELLGDDHDLHMLRQVAIKRSVQIDLVDESAELMSLIEPRQQELRSRALKLGSQLLREDASAFCERLHGYWKLWKKKSSPAEKSSRKSRDPISVKR
jgi:CHAD domain-containing protein